MSYVTLLAECYACRRLFTCNPLTVPSFRGEPICRDCIALVNERRRAAGLPLWPVAPDAYAPAEADGWPAPADPTPTTENG